MSDLRGTANWSDSPAAARPSRLASAALLRPAALAVVAAGLLALLSFSIIVASLNRGFDWSDEGFVYALIASGRTGAGEFWGFHHLLNPVYELLGSSVLVFRALRLLGYVTLGVVITLLARSVLQSWGVELGRAGWILVALVGQIGTFAAWSYPPRYLGYNELTSWCTQLVSAVLIALLLRRERPGAARRSDRALWLAAGVLLGILFMAKITAGLFLPLLAVGAAALGTMGGRWFARLGALLGGVATTLLLLVVSGVPVVDYLLNSFRLGADPVSQVGASYSITSMLRTYITATVDTVRLLAIPILLVALIVLAVRGIGKRGSGGDPERGAAPIEHVAVLLFVVLAVLLIDVVAITGSLASWTSLGAFNLFLLVVALFVFAAHLAEVVPPVAGARRGRARFVLAVVVFTLAPLVSALGTNNSIVGHTVFSVTIWAVGAGVALVVLARTSRAVTASARLLPLGLALLVMLISSAAVTADAVRHPYRSTPLFTQTSTIASGDLRGIRVTEEEASLVAFLGAAADSLDASEVPTLSLASPGALLAFNSSGWSAIWPGPGWAASIALSCDADRPDDLFVLQARSSMEGTDAYDRLVSGLQDCGISFPDDFEAVERHRSVEDARDVTIWRLR